MVPRLFVFLSAGEILGRKSARKRFVFSFCVFVFVFSFLFSDFSRSAEEHNQGVRAMP